MAWSFVYDTNMKPSNTLSDIVERVALQEGLTNMNRDNQWQIQAAVHNCTVLSHDKYSPSNII